MSARQHLLNLAIHRAKNAITASVKTLSQARKGRSIGGDVCLGAEECDQLVKELQEAEGELNEVLERRGAERV